LNLLHAPDVQVIAHLPYDRAIKTENGGGVTCVCWASRQANEFLTGHDNGDVLHWGVAPTGHIRLLAVYSVVDSGGESRDAVSSVNMMFGAEPCVVVHGGNLAELPQSLSLIHLKPEAGRGIVREQRSVTQVPWFGTLQGFCLVRPPGSLSVDDCPSAIITLTEGGYLCIHSVPSSEAPEPFASDFQGRPVEATALTLVRSAPVPMAAPWLSTSVSCELPPKASCAPVRRSLNLLRQAGCW
jgi:hypothetical protein